MNLDIAAIVAAVIAAVTGGISAIISGRIYKQNNLKRDMLDNLTSERIDNIHNIKINASIILSNATIIVLCEDINTTEMLSSLVNSINELWFIFKPVHKLDAEVLKSLTCLANSLIKYLKNKDSVEVDVIVQERDEFRKQVFLYIHSAWICIKHQILNGEQSGYNEFKKEFEKNVNSIEEIRREEDIEQIWHI
jgi:hypothetical protein